MKFSPISAAFPSFDIPLQLHFDINKTVIISDPVSGITTDQMLNCILSECIWGTLKYFDASDCSKHSEGLQYLEKSYKWSLEDWTIYSIHPSRSPPVENSITFGQFVDNYGPKFELTRKDMKSIKASFTHKGMPGEKVSTTLEEMKNFMRHTLAGPHEDTSSRNKSVHDQPDAKSSHQNSTSNSRISTKFEESSLAPILDSGYYHILPSFFKLLSYLHQKKCDFRIIFRTFGTDIERVAEELNTYCEGNHPLFPLDEVDPTQSVHLDGHYSPSDLDNFQVTRVKMDGSLGFDRRLHLPRFFGVLRRSSDKGGITFDYAGSIDVS